jgi:hypothetical protein
MQIVINVSSLDHMPMMLVYCYRWDSPFHLLVSEDVLERYMPSLWVVIRFRSTSTTMLMFSATFPLSPVTTVRFIVVRSRSVPVSVLSSAAIMLFPGR